MPKLFPMSQIPEGFDPIVLHASKDALLPSGQTIIAQRRPNSDEDEFMIMGDEEMFSFETFQNDGHFTGWHYVFPKPEEVEWTYYSNGGCYFEHGGFRLQVSVPHNPREKHSWYFRMTGLYPKDIEHGAISSIEDGQRLAIEAYNEHRDDMLVLKVPEKS